jgi:hypothetical protein
MEMELSGFVMVEWGKINGQRGVERPLPTEAVQCDLELE